MLRFNRLYKALSVYLLLCIVTEVLAPSVVYALTAGPNAPEFSSFEPVSTTNMVDDFSGDFTYNIPVVNIPGPEGSGYALSLSYHSGVNSEEEASWVGFGWTLNPGAINRGKRGYPDEYNGAKVYRFNKTKPNWTVSATDMMGLELSSTSTEDVEKLKEEGKKVQTVGNEYIDLSLSISKTTRFNNYRGFSKSVGFGSNYAGMGGLNMNFSGGQTTFDININPFIILGQVKKSEKKLANTKKKFASIDLKEKPKDPKKKAPSASGSVSGGGGEYFSYSVSDFMDNPSTPFSVSAYHGVAYNRNHSSQLNFFTDMGIEFGYSGSFSIQFPVRQTEVDAYGYMYNPNRSDLEDDNFLINKIISGTSSDQFTKAVGFDYQVERGTDINKRDRYLPIPFSTPDVFTVTGENMGGGFRLHRQDIGHYYPNFSLSYEKIRPMGLEFSVGLNSAGFGLKVGTGYHFTAATDWDKSFLEEGLDLAGFNLPDGHQFDPDKTPYFKFTNDKGGDLSITGNDDPASAAVEGKFLPVQPQGHKRFYPDLSELELPSQGAAEAQKSSHVTYVKYSDYNNINVNGKRLDEEVTSLNIIHNEINYPEKLDESIAQFGILDGNGVKKIFGLPVYTRDELNLNLAIDDKSDEVVDNFLAYPEHGLKVVEDAASAEEVRDILRNEYVTGQYAQTPFAVNHLLTQILSPNYIDVNDDSKADDGDFGGWTKFSYRKWSDDDGKTWYRYRTPYNGMLYTKGSLINKSDDVGSVSSGLKQVFYMKTIETKTHIACFVTNKTQLSDFSEIDHSELSPKTQTLLSGSYAKSAVSENKRKDALGAPEFSEETDQGGSAYLTDPAANPAVNPANNKKEINNPKQHLEKLEKIVLFAKSDMSRPLQVTNFEYDYSLCKGAPNTLDGAGKLTLKKVWFENEGIYNSRIAPYQFKYNYPKSYSDPVNDRYPEIAAFIQNINSLGDIAQNPPYSPQLLDSWGNYQEEKNALIRHRKMQDWVYQGESERFDPAAWNLKQIILPSGGQIHVQYEQKDYQYVQGEQALSLVSLKDNSSDGYKSEDTKYYLNLEDVNDFGILPEADREAALKDYAEEIKKYFDNPGGEPRFIYFKFLYDMEGNSAGIGDCSSDYVTGYASVTDADYDSGGLFIKLGELQTTNRYDNTKKVKKTVPRHICYDYYVTSADGLAKDNCGPDFKDYHDLEVKIRKLYSADEQTLKDIIYKNDEYDNKKLKQDVALNAFLSVKEKIFQFTPFKSQKCKSVNYGVSYLKVPMFNGKKGGGIRVKRLLMYDEGLETGDANLYGSEYLYEQANGVTSGVATNEPFESRDDHSLISILDRGHQNWLSRAISGRDKEQNEGPVGESLLPGASIGHSRVVIKNIHTGKTGTGYQVNEYNTCHDHPQFYKKTSISDARKKDWLVIPTPYFLYSVKKMWVGQGYAFVLNQMHGQPKQQSTYGGDYVPNTSGITPVASTKYTYFEENEELKIVHYNPDTKKLEITEKYPGREEDITMEMRSIQDEMLDLSLEIDLHFVWMPWYSLDVNFGILLNYNINEFNSHVTSKVVSYPAIVKSVEKTVNGITTIEESLAFSDLTGEPLISKVTDGYNGKALNITDGIHNGTYYSYKFPAAWMYPEMGRFVDIEGAVNSNQLSAMAGEITTYGTNGDWLTKYKDPEDNNIIDLDQNLKGVVSASATKLKKNWFEGDEEKSLVKNYILSDHNEDNDNVVNGASSLFDELIEKLNRVYRAEASFTYNTGRTPYETGSKIYKTGVINDFEMFDWKADYTKNDLGLIETNNKWLLANQVTKYSPQGLALEEMNTIGIPSAARFGYRNFTMPVMISANAEYESVFFQDFENKSGNAISSDAHSGKLSLDIQADPDYKLLDEDLDGVVLNKQLKEEGAIMKLWVKALNQENPVFENANASPELIINNTVHAPLVKIGASGDWVLYEAKVNDWKGLQDGQKLSITFGYTYASNEIVLLDDFRFQPLDAEATCYVYDKKNLRLLTQFDDQHFGVFYKYDSEGKLVSQQVETERGVKTIKETQYNIPLVERD